MGIDKVLMLYNEIKINFYKEFLCQFLFYFNISVIFCQSKFKVFYIFSFPIQYLGNKSVKRYSQLSVFQ